MAGDEAALLGPGDPPPVEVRDRAANGPVIVTCDHASNRVPAALGDLGLPRADLDSHFGWDIGAAEMAAAAAAALDAPAVYCGYSRLVIDCNRPQDAADSIVPRIDGRPVPGNAGLDERQRQLRGREIFSAYHAAIAMLMDQRARRGLPNSLVCMHSFTPVFGGVRRPWHVGISYGRRGRLARALLAELRRDGDLNVGEHEPYPVEVESDFAVPVHGDLRGNEAVLVEVRQDLLADAASARRWGTRLAAALRGAIAACELEVGVAPAGDL